MNFLILLFIGFFVENGCFELTHHYYCWKNKGKCESCKDWSCPRKVYMYEEKD